MTCVPCSAQEAAQVSVHRFVRAPSAAHGLLLVGEALEGGAKARPGGALDGRPHGLAQLAQQ